MNDTTQTGRWPDGASRVGAGVTPFQTDAEATIRLAVGAEELGFARFGTAEGWTNDAVVMLTQIAGVTSRIGLVTSVLPVWSRTPAAIRDCRYGPAAGVGGPLCPRARGEQPAARRGFARAHLGPTGRSDACDACRRQGAARRGSPAARPTRRQSAAPGRTARAARTDRPRGTRPGLGPPRR
jgi:hypothetical protein